MQQTNALPGVFMGKVNGVNDDGQPMVSWDDAPAVAARVAWMADPPDWADLNGAAVLVALLEGKREFPVVLGLLDAPEVNTPIPAKDHIDPTDPNPQNHPEVLRLSGKRELVLECGKAKISLRADGRIVILGGYLLSRSTGPHKIQGGSVQIN